MPIQHVATPIVDGAEVAFQDAIEKIAKLKGQSAIVFLAPDLLLEEYTIVKDFLDTHLSSYEAVYAYKKKERTDLEKILMSDDSSPNFQGALFSEVVAAEEGNRPCA